MRIPSLFAALFAALVLAAPVHAQDHSLEALQERIVGSWASIACELRPTAGEADVTPT